MEEDSSETSSDDTVNQNSENEPTHQLPLTLTDNKLEIQPSPKSHSNYCLEFDISIINARRRRKNERRKEIHNSLERKQGDPIHLQNSDLCDEASQFRRSNMERIASPMASPIRESQDLSKDTFDDSPSTPSLIRPKIIYDPIGALHPHSIEEFNDAPPLISSDYETQADERDANNSSPQGFIWFKKSYGKGKEAANPKFRYKKRSKPEVSSAEAQSQGEPVKLFKETSDAPETKPGELQSSEADIIRISPAVKRKIPDESCGSGLSIFFGNRADDDSKIAKKLKFDDDEKASEQCPTIAALILQKDGERSGSSKYIDQSQTDQSRNESELFPQPSTSGLSKVVSYASSSEESYDLCGNDVTYSDRGESSVTSGSEVSPQSETSGSLTSVTSVETNSEREESLVTSGSEVEESERSKSITSVSTDVPLSERGESSPSSECDLSDIFASDAESPSNTEAP